VSKPTAEALLPVIEVARLWRCSRQHIYDLIADGELRVVDVGRRRAQTRVPASSLDEYVERKARRAAKRRAA